MRRTATAWRPESGCASTSLSMRTSDAVAAAAIARAQPCAKIHRTSVQSTSDRRTRRCLIQPRHRSTLRRTISASQAAGHPRQAARHLHHQRSRREGAAASPRCGTPAARRSSLAHRLPARLVRPARRGTGRRPRANASRVTSAWAVTAAQESSRTTEASPATSLTSRIEFHTAGMRVGVRRRRTSAMPPGRARRRTRCRPRRTSRRRSARRRIHPWRIRGRCVRPRRARRTSAAGALPTTRRKPAANPGSSG